VKVLFIIPKLPGRFAGPNFPRVQKQMFVLCQAGQGLWLTYVASLTFALP